MGILRAIVSLSLLWLLALVPARSADTAAASAPVRGFRILHVMSYHSPWRWTDGQLQGFRDGFGAGIAELKVFQMNAKSLSSRADKERMGAEARALVESWKPDLLYTSDDEAQEFVARYFVGSKLPIVFSGVNKDPADYGFVGSPNVTGVVEREHFAESVRLLRELVPSARRIAVVFDDAPLWKTVGTRMREALRNMPDVEVVAWDTITRYEDFQRRMEAYPQIADAVALIGVFNFSDAQGRNVPYDEVLRWTAAHSRLPDFSFWIDRVHFGTLCAVTVSEREQGLAAGRLAHTILVDGRKPASLPIQATTKGLPAISLARARMLGIKPSSSILLSSEVFTGFDWNRTQ